VTETPVHYRSDTSNTLEDSSNDGEPPCAGKITGRFPPLHRARAAGPRTFRNQLHIQAKRRVANTCGIRSDHARGRITSSQIQSGCRPDR